MMAGNPSWWSINGMHTKSQLIYSASNSQLSSGLSHSDLHHPTQDLPVRSWSQLLLGGLGGGEDERFGASLFQQQKKMEKWEDQVLNLNPSFSTTSATEDVKQESTTQIYGDHALDDDEFQSNSWPRHHHQVSSPTSCITTLSNTIFNFSATSPAAAVTQRKNHYQDHSSECNSTSTGGVTKKARVQQSVQPALKVRKEKLGDRITALHQLVSPFGKTDTASVLSEAIGYIRFLQSQIEALSSPYMSNGGAGNTVHHQHSVQERNCLFPEEHSQFLNGIAIEGRGASKQDSQGRSGVKDLRSRGLCLVPISCTEHVANQNGADYWAPAAFGGGF